MFLSPPPPKNLRIDGKKIPIGAAEAFIADLYLNAGLKLPDEFDPVTEIVKVVTILRQQNNI